ncbi:MAG: hypothetical protein BWY64_03414 [bacterium ADurb.Bin363]|nr:MAG: hypothetical protein BWY64_03414 [bacterium ADurb.Bin363]
MIITFSPQVTKFLDIGIAILRNAIKDNERLNICIREVRDINNSFKNNIEEIKILIDNEEIKNQIINLEKLCQEREEILQKTELSIKDNNNTLMYQSVMDFQKSALEIQFTSLGLIGQLGSILGEPPSEDMNALFKMLNTTEIIKDEKLFTRLPGMIRYLENIVKYVEFLLYICQVQPEILKEVRDFIIKFKEETDNIKKTLDTFGENGKYRKIYGHALFIENILCKWKKSKIRSNFMGQIFYSEGYKSIEKYLNIIEYIFSMFHSPLLEEMQNVLIEKLAHFGDVVRETFIAIGKIEILFRGGIPCSLPFADDLLESGLNVIENKIEVTEFENKFNNFTNYIILILNELYTFQHWNIVRNKVGKKYYPFFEERGRILKDNIDYFLNLFKVSMGRELIFREEANFAPPGQGKLSLLLQFKALGAPNLNPELYIVDREIATTEVLSSLPLPIIHFEITQPLIPVSQENAQETPVHPTISPPPLPPISSSPPPLPPISSSSGTPSTQNVFQFQSWKLLPGSQQLPGSNQSSKIPTKTSEKNLETKTPVEEQIPPEIIELKRKIAENEKIYSSFFTEAVATYREKIKILIEKLKSDYREYIKIRENFFGSLSQEEDEPDLLKTSKKDSSEEEDLFSSLLKELDMTAIKEDKKDIKKEPKKTLTVQRKMKKIIDKDRFIKYMKNLKNEIDTYRNLLQSFYIEICLKPDLSEDMEFSELRDCITGVYKEIVPLIILEELLTRTYNKNEDLLDRISDFPYDPQIIELKEKLEKLKKILLEINTYFTDADKKRLIKGIEDIESTFSCLVEANEIISVKEVEKNLIICFKCKAKNPPGMTYCKVCKAVLPFADVSVTSMELSDTGELLDKALKDLVNQDIKSFKRLMDKVLKGKVETNKLKDFMDKFSQKILLTKNNFEKELKPLLIRYRDVEELKETAEEFIIILDEFQTALKEGNKFFEQKEGSYLKKCFSMLLEGDKKMQKSIKKVQNCIEVHTKKSN